MQINTTPEDHIPETFTVESLKEGGLTEQEIAALSEGDDPIVTIPTEEATQDAEAQADGIGSAPSQAAAGQTMIEEQPAPEPVQIPDVTEAQTAIADFDSKLEALAERYDDGEMTRAEFLAEQKLLAAEQAKAQAQIDRATEAMQAANQAVVRHWEQTLEAYKPLASGLWSEQHIDAWDRHLRAVTNPQGPYASLSRAQQVQLAHRNYATEYETLNGKPLDGDAALPTARKAAKKLMPRTDDRPEPPPTLAGLNSDSTEEIEDSTFAVLDREIMKDPLRAEAMFARMSDDQRERYLNEA